MAIKIIKVENKTYTIENNGDNIYLTQKNLISLHTKIGKILGIPDLKKSYERITGRKLKIK